MEVSTIFCVCGPNLSDFVQKKIRSKKIVREWNILLANAMCFENFRELSDLVQKMVRSKNISNNKVFPVHQEQHIAK